MGANEEGPGPPDASPTLSAAELAERAGIDRAHLGALCEAGILQPEADGRHRVGDLHRIRIADAFLAAGIELAALRRASEAGAISFRYYDLLHPEPGRPSQRTYGELRASLGEREQRLVELFGVLGLAEPDHDGRLTEADEALVLELLDLVEATGDRHLALRAVRLIGDSTRRAMDAVLTVYDEAVTRMVGATEGLPPQETFDAYLLPWGRIAQFAPRLSRWLTERHLSNAIDAYSVDSTERFLAAGGFVAARAEQPPAIAFVDLSGFTRLAEERGDEPVARVALAFGRMAEAHAARAGGRLVKLLGDGALLRFPDAASAVDATLGLLAALPSAGLPRGHAGVDAGSIIVREGDVFGRTVNLASRVADVADDGELLVTRAVVDAIDPDRYVVRTAGEATLQGLDAPIELYRIEDRAGG